MKRPGAGSREPGTGIGAVLVVMALVASVSAQSPSGSRLPDPGSRIEVEPIRCWRQATSGAVTIGEPFRVVLTCAVFESADAQVVPDESRLNVASIQMAPFEIIGGTHPPDVRRGFRRFLQYEYDVRIISRDAIGQDVNVPPLTISYRIHSRVGAAAKLEGRDLSYVLPAVPIKVLSLVPADAGDIRDASEASLAAVDSLRSRSRMFEVLAIALGVLAGVTLLFALVPIARRSRAAATIDRNQTPDRAILAAASASLRDAQRRAAADRWNDEIVAAALSAARVIAAVAAHRAISRKPLPANGATPDGRLRVDHGLLGHAAVSVSSAATPQDLDGVARFDGLRSALELLTAALYRREPERDAVALDAAVRQASEAAAMLTSERAWIKTVWARR
jgi:hypothetical protein